MFAAEPSPPSAPAPAPGPSQDHIDLALSAIGIDAEPARPGPRGLLDRIASASERAELAALAASCLGTPAPDGSATELPATHEPATDSPAPDGPAIPWDRVLFSAKESVFKAWQPLTHLGLEFSEAAVTLQIDGRFAVKILREVPADVRGLSWHGRWVIIDGLILTVVLVGTARSRHAVSRAGLPLT
jgi:4'-phosphopantetheinyl transferase EntD